MTSTILAILSLTVFGVPIALLVDRRARGPLLVGTSFLYGSGAIFLTLFGLSIVHVRWTSVTVAVAALSVFVIASVFVIRRPAVAGNLRPATRPYIFDLGTIVALTGFALFATLASLWEWDFWAIWGLKAKVFLEAGGIDWRFLGSQWNTFSHPDYPILVPLNYDFATLIGGGWSDRWLGLLGVAWSVAVLLIARGLAARETSPFLASLLTLALASRAMSTYIGLAEGALIAFGGAGVLFLRAALRDDDAISWRHGALMLGFAANCKNEGMALLIAVTIAVGVVSWSRGLGVSQQGVRTRARVTAGLLRLWPSYALAAPWLFLRLTHALPTDIAGGSPFSRLMERLPQIHQILGFLAQSLHEPWFWLAILIGILVAPTAARKSEIFVLLVTTIQLAFYVLAYLATPNELRWHVLTSWARLTGQIALPITFAVFLMLANSLRDRQDAPHAEARPDQ